MKEYFYLEGKEIKGPLTLKEIRSLELSNSKLVWYDGIDNWTPLINVPELNTTLKKYPPPPPIDNQNIKSTVADKIKSQPKEHANNDSPINGFKPSRKEMTWLISWSSFHLFALILSNVQYFNKQPKIHYIGEPTSKESFWPFVKFLQKGYTTLTEGEYKYYAENGLLHKKDFYGLFYQYDWIEFAFYFFAGIVTYILIKFSKNS